MNKNTVLAIVLSTLVVIGAFVFQGVFSSPSSNAAPQVTQNVVNPENSETANEVKEASNAIKFEENESSVKEEDLFKSIETSKAIITFTRKGGDIVSYKLKDHLEDKKKNLPVEMADNYREDNRAFAISLGNQPDNKILNAVFECEIAQEDAKDAEGKVTDSTKTVKFTKKSADGITLVKTYTLKDDYMFKLDISFIGPEGKSLSTNGYALRSSPQIGPKYDSGNRYERREFVSYKEKDRSKSISENDFKMYDEDYIWNGVEGKYFAAFVMPATSTNMAYSYYSGIKSGSQIDSQAILVRKPINTEENKVTDTYYVYLGPRNEKELKVYNVKESNVWGLEGVKFNSVISGGMLGWLEWILKWILELMYMMIPNWGVAIILTTIILKLALFPISKKQMIGSLKMQQIQPKIKQIQENYKNNPQQMQMMLAKVYRESGYNPMSGCLPMVFQFLILFAMYNLFNNYFEFRNSGFIPGWIDDLSTGDYVVKFGVSIPLIGEYLRILPIIYLASQLFYGKITSNGGMAGASSKQMKFMMYGMPILFFFLFYSAPSGLLLYWTVSNIFQMGQQIVINKMKAKYINEPAKVNKVVNAGKFSKKRK